MGSGLVPVGAGVVMGWVGLGLRGRRHPLRSPSWLPPPDEGRSVSGGDDIHKGPHPTSQPLPPLRGRRRFPKTLYLKAPAVPLWRRYIESLRFFGETQF